MNRELGDRLSSALVNYALSERLSLNKKGVPLEDERRNITLPHWMAEALNSCYTIAGLKLVFEKKQEPVVDENDY